VTPEQRAARLLRWYPKAWRSVYGEEFAELLIADIAERPRSPIRTADVARGGIVARLAGAGLCGCTLEPAAQARTSLISLGWCVAIFTGFGAAMWAQLTIGWQWSAPDNAATAVAMVVMSAAMLAFGVLVAAAAAPVLWSAASRIARGRGPHGPGQRGPGYDGPGQLGPGYDGPGYDGPGRGGPGPDGPGQGGPRQGGAGQGLLGPAAFVVTCALILFAGGTHFGNGWPGTGGHPWAGQGLVPGGVAAFSWACTLWVSSYWAHPGALAGFPAAELAWMVLSPLAVASLVGGAAALVRRTELSPRVLAFEARLGTAACAVMAVFLGGCCAWIVDGGPGPRNLFHAGAIDAAGVGVLTIAFLAARQAARMARAGTAHAGTARAR
jgi:hypothetical protein